MLTQKYWNLIVFPLLFNTSCYIIQESPSQHNIDGVQRKYDSIFKVNLNHQPGFAIDRGLAWGSHIDKLCGKLGAACFALHRLARVVSADVVRTCYFATVHSLLQYGDELCRRAADRERAFRMQKRALFSRLRCLRGFKTQRESGSCRMVTRGADKLAPVAHRLAKTEKSTHVMGPAVYNPLPDHVTAATSLASFKNKLKSWLIQKALYSVEEFFLS